MQQKIFVDSKEINFLVVNNKGKVINNGDDNFDTWEQTYVDLNSLKVGENLSISFNKGIHKRISIENYLHGKDEVKFVNKKGKTFIGRKWKSYEEDTYTTLDYPTTKIELLNKEDNLIIDGEIIVEDTSKLDFVEVKKVITVFYDGFVLGNYERWHDEEEGGREYVIINNEVTYLDTIPYFVDRNLSLLNNVDLIDDISSIEKLDENTEVKTLYLKGNSRPYCIDVNGNVYTYRSEKSRDKELAILKFLFIQFFVNL